MVSMSNVNTVYVNNQYSSLMANTFEMHGDSWNSYFSLDNYQITLSGNNEANRILLTHDETENSVELRNYIHGSDGTASYLTFISDSLKNKNSILIVNTDFNENIANTISCITNASGLRQIVLSNNLSSNISNKITLDSNEGIKIENQWSWIKLDMSGHLQMNGNDGLDLNQNIIMCT